MSAVASPEWAPQTGCTRAHWSTESCTRGVRVAARQNLTGAAPHINWTGLARVVRGKLLEVREEDFVMAARIAGGSAAHTIRRHPLPSFMSYPIVNVTLAVPGTILGETVLSFLGIGLRPPAVSWGVLQQQAQNIRSVALHPWLMIPGLCVILAVLAFNFLGDGLRDAADPYHGR